MTELEQLIIEYGEHTRWAGYYSEGEEADRKNDGAIDTLAKIKAALEQQAARIAALESAEKEAVPVAWMVTGGKTFVDKPFLSEAQAEKSIAERKDGARKVALYTHAPASKEREALELIANQDPVEMALDPTWATRVASAALSQKVGDQQ